MNNNLVSIITVNYNNYNDTILMIDSIINYVNCRYEIIVVDNGSKGDDFKILNSRYSKSKNI